MGSQYAAGRRRGRVIFNNSRSAVDCFVCDLTDFGATLEVTDARSLPSHFHLLINGEATARDCTVRHLSVEEVGVVFKSKKLPEASFGRKVWSAQAPGEPPDQMSLAYLKEAQLGIVLVDADMRAPLVNDEFCRIWKVPDALAESCPPVRELIFRGLGAAANSEDLETLISHAKSGDPSSLDIRLNDVDVVRFHCVPLPARRRMLTFTRISDMAQRIDHLELLSEAIDNVDQGIIILDHELTVLFVNVKAREMWWLTQEQCDKRQSYAHFLCDVAATGVYDIADDQLEDYVMLRYTTVQSGNPVPMDVHLNGDRVIRASCAALPSGGRMLTYTDVTDLVRRAEKRETEFSIQRDFPSSDASIADVSAPRSAQG